jgi:hypothetical protein
MRVALATHSTRATSANDRTASSGGGAYVLPDKTVEVGSLSGDTTLVDFHNLTSLVELSNCYLADQDPVDSDYRVAIA